MELPVTHDVDFATAHPQAGKQNGVSSAQRQEQRRQDELQISCCVARGAGARESRSLESDGRGQPDGHSHQDGNRPDRRHICVSRANNYHKLPKVILLPYRAGF